MKVMTSWVNRAQALAAVAAASVLMSCSIHPLPDDVSRYSTEEIVRNVRCEAKAAVRERIRDVLIDIGLGHMAPERVIEPGNLEIIRRRSRETAAKFAAYSASTIAYRFEFEITENNDNGGSLKFSMP